MSEAYNGCDEFMRVLMRVADRFESWACRHINFDELDDVWPYVLESKFGEACMQAIRPIALTTFDEDDCLRIAMKLRLPILHNDKLKLPVDVAAQNSVEGSPFRVLRIRTMRDSLQDGDPIPYTGGDSPFDEQFDDPYFVLLGERDDEAVETIATRQTYAELVSLARKLAPGVDLPASPTIVFRS